MISWFTPTTPSTTGATCSSTDNTVTWIWLWIRPICTTWNQIWINSHTWLNTCQPKRKEEVSLRFLPFPWMSLWMRQTSRELNPPNNMVVCLCSKSKIPPQSKYKPALSPMLSRMKKALSSTWSRRLSHWVWILVMSPALTLKKTWMKTQESRFISLGTPLFSHRLGATISIKRDRAMLSIWQQVSSQSSLLKTTILNIATKCLSHKTSLWRITQLKKLLISMEVAFSTWIQWLHLSKPWTYSKRTQPMEGLYTIVRVVQCR